MRTRKFNEDTFTTWDGENLFYRIWPAADPASDQALILLHRGHEHSGRLQGLVDDLDLPQFHCFAWDARGHGKSPGERGAANSFMCLVKDLDAFARHLSITQSIPYENIAVVANSVGSVIASTWVHDYAPPIRAMVMVAPAFDINLYVPFARTGLKLLRTLRSGATVKSYVSPKLLTHDAEQARAYSEDPEITGNICVEVLLGVYEAGDRVVRDAGAIQVPILVQSAGSDKVVKTGAQLKFFDGLSSTRKQFKSYRGYYHALFHELNRAVPISDARAFLVQEFNEKTVGPEQTVQRLFEYTDREYRHLQQSASPMRESIFGIQRFLLGTLGRLSDGIRVGLSTGFDSGQSLDYLYRNRAGGAGALGRLIDRNYLNAVGWVGIRTRGDHLRTALDGAVQRCSAGGRQVRILDVATGCGRYVLDVLEKHRDAPVSAVLRDITPGNLEAGRRLAKERGCLSATFERGDAFKAEELRNTLPRPDIVIVSGLYELFPDNEWVLESLKSIASILSPGGRLIYTCQPWHPELETIARTLTNRNGDPWIMRRRTQAEMDALVELAGLRKREMHIDDLGIFTVSIATPRNIATREAA